MLGKPFVCMALSSSQRVLAPLALQRCPLFMPFLNRSVLYYLLRQCRKAGLDTVLILLDEALYGQLDHLRLLVAGLPLQIEWLPYAEPELWQPRLLEQMNEEDPVLLFQNPALDLLPLEQLLRFHTEQQADCSLRRSPRGQGLPLHLDSQGQLLGRSDGPPCYDTRCYLIEPDIFEQLLRQQVNLLRQPLLPVLQEAAEFVFGLLSDRLWAEWLEPRDYFASLRLILQQGLLEPVHKRKLQHSNATVWIGEDVLIDSDVSFAGPVVIDDQAALGAGVRIQGPAVIGAGSRILAQCRLEQSWIWPGCEIGRNSQILHSWLGEQVQIGPGSRLQRLWAADHCRLELSRPLPAGSILGPYTRLKLDARPEPAALQANAKSDTRPDAVPGA